MSRLLSWAKTHKVAAGFLGCGGLILLFFVIIVVIAIIAAVASPGDPEPEAQQTEQAAEEQPPAEEPAEEAPAEEPTTEAAEEEPADETPAEEPAEDSLAVRVEQALLEANAVDSFKALEPTSPGFWIAKIEDIATGEIRVYAQADFTDDEKEELARWVMNMACYNIEDLDTVVIRDTSGVDKNFFAFMMNPPTLCSAN